MGIGILSEVARVHADIVVACGVQLQETDSKGRQKLLPDPQKYPEKYVAEVISQWEAEHSSRPPTWNQLIAVLREVGLQTASQHIEEFMKGNNDYFLCTTACMDTRLY